MIFSTHSAEHGIGKAVFLPKKYPFCIAGYFFDGGLVFCGEYFHAKKHVAIHAPLCIYQYWVHFFSLYFLVSKKSACRCGNSYEDRHANFRYAHERLLCCVAWDVENLNDTTEEPGSNKPDPQRDERIPIGPVDV